jgi:hypothetical protein
VRRRLPTLYDKPWLLQRKKRSGNGAKQKRINIFAAWPHGQTITNKEKRKKDGGVCRSALPTDQLVFGHNRIRSLVMVIACGSIAILGDSHLGRRRSAGSCGSESGLTIR